jgi:hypothetical protein
MDLDSKQTRRLYLAGTVAFPTPFPTAGGISVEMGSTSPCPGRSPDLAEFVVIQEKSDHHNSVYRVVRKEDVAAIFFPGDWKNSDRGRVFRFTKRYGVRDFERGEWFLASDIDADTISKRFELDIRSRDSGAKGIVFVPRDRAVLTYKVLSQTAGATCRRRRRRRRRGRRPTHLLCDPICRECDPIPCDCIEG